MQIATNLFTQITVLTKYLTLQFSLYSLIKMICYHWQKKKNVQRRTWAGEKPRNLCAISRILQGPIQAGSYAQHSFPFRWHSESSTSDIQFRSNLHETGATPDRLSRALHCNANGGRWNQMYRNDLCTWLDILSLRHAWPPIATSLPVARNERRTAERKQFHIHPKSPFEFTPTPFVLLRIVNILLNISQTCTSVHVRVHFYWDLLIYLWKSSKFSLTLVLKFMDDKYNNLDNNIYHGHKNLNIVI